MTALLSIHLKRVLRLNTMAQSEHKTQNRPSHAANLHCASDLVVASDHRIEFALFGECRDIVTVLLEVLTYRYGYKKQKQLSMSQQSVLHCSENAVAGYGAVINVYSSDGLRNTIL